MLILAGCLVGLGSLSVGSPVGAVQDGGGQDRSRDAGSGVRQSPGYSPAPDLTREQVVDSLQRAMAHLADIQNDDGSWGGKGPESTLEDGFALATYGSWALGAHSIACMSLAGSARADETHLAMLNKAVDHLCSVKVPERDSDWDIDYIWSSVYGFVACIELLQDERFQVEPWASKVETRGRKFLKILVGHQSLSGGWAYYDNPPYTTTPTWATSFTTAAVLPALFDAKHKLGWDVDEKVLQRAIRYVERCALPNGAYSYSLAANRGVGGVESINQVQGSLGRIQVCNWALSRCGIKRVTPEILREGLESFFRYHGFLDHARTRPIPHEGFYANAGYFYFFGHYYAAKVIELLPAEERVGWYKRLSPHLAKTQWANGGASDFLRPPYMVVASTSFLIAGLQADLDATAVAAEARRALQENTAGPEVKSDGPQGVDSAKTPKTGEGDKN